MKIITSHSNTTHFSVGQSRYPGKTETLCGMNLRADEHQADGATCIFCTAAHLYSDGVKSAVGKYAKENSGRMGNVEDIASIAGISEKDVTLCVGGAPDLCWSGSGRGVVWNQSVAAKVPSA